MLAVVLMGVACGSGEEAEQPFERDPHSYSRPDEVVVTHLSLDLDVDFETRQLAGTATLTIDNKTGASELWLDTWGLEIDAADFGSDDRPTTFTIGGKTWRRATGLTGPAILIYGLAPRDAQASIETEKEFA